MRYNLFMSKMEIHKESYPYILVKVLNLDHQNREQRPQALRACLV